MSIIFDGRSYSKKIEEELAKKVKAMRAEGVVPKLATFVDPGNKAGLKYVQMKQAAAKRIGAEVEVYRINKLRGLLPVIQSIKLLNSDPEVHGIMVQLPLAKNMSQYTHRIVNTIDHQKDVDGLCDDSSFPPATVRAIEAILDEAVVDKNDQIVVLGSRGEVGKRLVKQLSFKGFSVVGYDKELKNTTEVTKKADVLISATGNPGIIQAHMVKPQSILIDVGYPQGDIDFKSVSAIAAFITPVPGGVGPVTVVSLLQNLVDAAQKK